MSSTQLHHASALLQITTSYTLYQTPPPSSPPLVPEMNHPTTHHATISPALPGIDTSFPTAIVHAAMTLESLFQPLPRPRPCSSPQPPPSTLLVFLPAPATTAAPTCDSPAARLALLVRWIGVQTPATTVPLLLARCRVARAPSRGGRLCRRRRRRWRRCGCRCCCAR